MMGEINYSPDYKTPHPKPVGNMLGVDGMLALQGTEIARLRRTVTQQETEIARLREALKDVLHGVDSCCGCLLNSEGDNLARYVALYKEFYPEAL